MPCLLFKSVIFPMQIAKQSSLILIVSSSGGAPLLPIHWRWSLLPSGTSFYGTNGKFSAQFGTKLHVNTITILTGNTPQWLLWKHTKWKMRFEKGTERRKMLYWVTSSITTHISWKFQCYVILVNLARVCIKFTPKTRNKGCSLPSRLESPTHKTPGDSRSGRDHICLSARQ